MKEESSGSQADNSSAMLEEHKKMLIMSGNLSDFQLKNLKTWPFIVFDGVESVEIDYDFSESVKNEKGDMDEGIGAGRVMYNLTTENPPTKEQIEQLRVWTKFLFWKDTKVEVTIKV